ncbi:MAG: M64 family metallopeptidase [Verrucomicrobiota bacterium]
MGKITLEKAQLVAGTLKPQQNSTDEKLLLISLEQTKDIAHWSLSIDDPSVQRLEYEDPEHPGALKTKWVTSDDAAFIVLAPLNHRRPAACHPSPGRSSDVGRRRGNYNQQSSGAHRATRNRDEMNRRLLIFIVFTLAAAWHAAGQAQLLTLLTNGPTSRRLNIVFFSEGYTTNDLSHFPADAQVMLNRILSSSPMDKYSNYFNAFAIAVPSNQSGSDHYTPTTVLVDTYFNSRFDSSGVQRLVTIDGVGQSRANALLAQFVPEYDLVAIVVNDTQYGGSGGSFLISSINSASPEIATHEMGHTFAGLGDEYSYAGSTPSEKPNATTQTNLASIKWRSWIPVGTPIPTPDDPPYYNVVGLFRGAVYSENYFRPKHDCKMRSLGVPFCEICSETLIKSIYNKVGMIEGYSPANNITALVTNAIARTFSVTNLVPNTHSLSVQWFTNNVAVPGATSAVFQVSGFTLLPNVLNPVRVDVKDPTSLVLSAPTNMMKSSLTWQTYFTLEEPRLSISAAPNAINLAWPPSATGFFLEQTADLFPPGTWTPFLLISNQSGLTVVQTNSPRFYRLRR